MRENPYTVSPPPTPIHDVSVRLGKSPYPWELHYRPVELVLYREIKSPYPWMAYDEGSIWFEKRYSFSRYMGEKAVEFRENKDHSNDKQGRCECGYSSCDDLGLWEGTEEEIYSNSRFNKVLQERVEYLIKIEERAVKAKEKRLAKIAADPAAWEAKKIELKAKRDAKKAELAVSQKRADLVKLASQIHAGHWPNGIAPQNPPATIGKQ